MIETLAQIDAPHYCAGLVLQDDIVVEAAPIIKWMAKRRLTRDQVRDYCKKNGYKVSVIWEMDR